MRVSVAREIERRHIRLAAVARSRPLDHTLRLRRRVGSTAWWSIWPILPQCTTVMARRIASNPRTPWTPRLPPASTACCTGRRSLDRPSDFYSRPRHKLARAMMVMLTTMMMTTAMTTKTTMVAVAMAATTATTAAAAAAAVGRVAVACRSATRSRPSSRSRASWRRSRPFDAVHASHPTRHISRSCSRAS